MGLTIRTEERIAMVTLDQPPVNALSSSVLEEIRQTFQAFADQDVGAVILTGAGNHAFCAGADVKELAQAGREEATKLARLGQEAFAAVEDCPVPVIAAVNNLALGGGCELAMAADIRVASDRARFGQPEVWIGLIPAWGGSTRLPRMVGAAKAKELIFTGQMINAQEAQRIGLVQKIVPDGEEVRAAIDIARMITRKGAPLAIKEAKKTVNAISGSGRADAMRLEMEAAGRLALTADLAEGIKAFVEKRSPVFTGA